MTLHVSIMNRPRFAPLSRHVVIPILCVAAMAATQSCTKRAESGARTFNTPEEAVRVLDTAVKAGRPEDVIAVFGPEGKDVVDTSDPSTSRRNREVFAAAMTEGWQLIDQGPSAKTLVVGNEAWPFPIPLVKDANGWRFDAAAGKEEVIARRIGRNELAAIQICRTYVNAQHVYASEDMMASRREFMHGRCEARAAARTDSTGRHLAGKGGARWENLWRMPPRKVRSLIGIARSRRRFTATTSGF